MKIGPKGIEIASAAGLGPLEKMFIQRDEHGCAHHFHHPMTAPNWLPAAQDAHMRPDDPVLGVTVGEAAYTLPWWMLKNHHVANLELESRPVMVVLCEACAGASAFEAVVDGKRHHFRVEGKYNGTHILRDDETDSLWTPFNGVAVHGSMKGRWMKRIPLYQCTWGEWKTLHPQARVPDGEGESRTGHGSSFPSPETVRPVPFSLVSRLHEDDRLNEHVLVLGVVVGEASRAYPLPRLKRTDRVVNDRLNGTDLVVFSRRQGWFAAAFDRSVDGRALRFRFAGGDGVWRAEDEDTRSRWDLDGRCVEGALAGKRLRPLDFGLEKWFRWSTGYPGTDIYAPRSGAAKAPRARGERR